MKPHCLRHTRLLFQFTHPRGVRYNMPRFRPFIGVSIHAPARGAIKQVEVSEVRHGFNSRTREGCDFWNFLPRF